MLVSRDQNQKKYSIPDSLIHNSGTITATFNSVNYSVTLSGLATNSLYFLYVRSVLGVTQLFFTASVPSVYRVSYPEAILVGAFYANGLSPVAFGSFVNIEGIPTTANEVPFNLSPLFSGGNGTATVSGTNTYIKSGANVFIALRPSITKGTASGSLALSGLPFLVSQYGKSEVHCGTANLFTGLLASGTVYARCTNTTTNVEYAQVSGTTQGINPITVSNMTAGAMDLLNEFVYTTSYDGKQLKDL